MMIHVLHIYTPAALFSLVCFRHPNLRGLDELKPWYGCYLFPKHLSYYSGETDTVCYTMVHWNCLTLNCCSATMTLSVARSPWQRQSSCWRKALLSLVSWARILGSPLICSTSEVSWGLCVLLRSSELKGLSNNSSAISCLMAELLKGNENK